MAAKTGTSQAYHDNWTIGYTRDVTVGVWVGNFDRTPLATSSGVTGAGPIFHAVMLAAQRASDCRRASDAILARPPDVERVTICALSGMRANAWCPSRAKEWLPVDAEALPCSWHHQSDEGLLTIYPPEFRAWAADDGDHAKGSRASTSSVQLPQHAPLSGQSVASAGLAIANPPAGAIYSIDPTLRAEFQALPLRAVTTAPAPRSHGWSTVPRSARRRPNEPMSWPLRVGTHRIEARDTDGRRAEAAVVVR